MKSRVGHFHFVTPSGGTNPCLNSRKVLGPSSMLHSSTAQKTEMLPGIGHSCAKVGAKLRRAPRFTCSALRKTFGSSSLSTGQHDWSNLTPSSALSSTTDIAGSALSLGRETAVLMSRHGKRQWNHSTPPRAAPPRPRARERSGEQQVRCPLQSRLTESLHAATRCSSPQGRRPI